MDGMVTRNERRTGIATADRLRDEDFEALSRLIQGEYGIKMPPAKKTMLEARLQKRVRALGLDSLRRYVEYLFSREGNALELVQLGDVVTTNKTDFFREPAHFDLLLTLVLPELLGREGGGRSRGGEAGEIKVWSAGCATGEEPYSLAIALNEFAARVAALSFSILATDLSTGVLERGRRGVYDRGRIAGVPQLLQRRYFLQSRDRALGQVRLKPFVRAQVRFERLNLMEERYAIAESMDIVFFRNVIIYFSRETQQTIVNRVCRQLRVGGYLFMGHSETLFGMDLPLEQVAPTVYRRTST